MLIGFLLGGIVFGVVGVKVGYNLPRDPTTEVNVSVDKLKANKGSSIDFSNVIDADTNLSRKEKRKLNKKGSN